MPNADTYLNPPKAHTSYPDIVHVGAAVIRRGDLFLVTQRTDNSMWEFPGGKAEPNEDIRATVAREIREELGLSIQVHQHMTTVYYDHQWAVPAHITGRITSSHRDALVHLFYCTVNWHETAELVLDQRSVKEYAWTLDFSAFMGAANPANQQAFNHARTTRS